MMYPATRRFLAIIIFTLLSLLSVAQSGNEQASKETKPYRILTSGKQVTVKSNKDIKSIMVWTSSGHRIIEQRGVSAGSYVFNVSNTGQRIFFIMLQYAAKTYTEKIGVE